VNEQRAAELEAFRRSLNADEQRTLEAERIAASARLSRTEDAGRVLAAAQDAMARGEHVLRRHLQLVPAPAIACRAGCHWCCHLKVSATAPEILLIAEYLQTRAPAGWLEVVRERAAALARDPRIFSAEAKAEAHLPCALLSEQGACSVYAVRPLICRGYTSSDPEPCQRMLDDDSVLVPLNETLAREHAALSLGLISALKYVGLPPDLLELTAGLHVALSEPQALQRWLAGEPIFAPALADRGL
jgi:Fe-S-cluster containining protein